MGRAVRKKLRKKFRRYRARTKRSAPVTKSKMWSRPNKRRRLARRNYSIISRNLIGHILPPKKMATFQYVATNNCTISTTSFRNMQILVTAPVTGSNVIFCANSIYDPFLGITSDYNIAPQPYNFWKQYYDKYQVLSSVIEITFIPIAQNVDTAHPFVLGIYLSENVTLGSTAPTSDVCETIPGWRTRIVSGFHDLVTADGRGFAYPQSHIRKLRHYFSLRKHMNTQQSSTTVGTFGYNPAKMMYYIICGGPLGHVDPAFSHNFDLRVAIKYRVLLSDRKDLDDVSEMNEG